MGGISTCAQGNTSTFCVSHTNVVQLASNFVGFFEKLGENLSQLAATIPAYEEILQYDMTATSDRFKSSLCEFYVDLFEFFQAISRVFTQKSGSKYFGIEHQEKRLILSQS